MSRPGDPRGGSTRGGIELRSPSAIFDDERAIEGLPIRLVIALLVGVAALSVMMTMIDDVGGIGKTELDADPDTIDLSHNGERDVTITVVDDDGTPIEGARVILSGESARLPGGTRHAESDGDGAVSFEGISPELERNQDQGTLSIGLKHTDSGYQDERENSQILVLK